MTKATQDYNLSKLDLFTPNPLHPLLPRLAIGTYSVMGGTATMIAEGDILFRRDHIYKLLGEKAQDASYMRKRPATHNRIIAHLGIVWSYTKGHWRTLPEFANPPSGFPEDKRPKSMRSKDNREEYVQKALQKEWAAMGISAGGLSEDSAIVLD